MKITTTIMIAILTGCAAESIDNNQNETANHSDKLTLETTTLHAGALSNFRVTGAEASETVTLYGSDGVTNDGECPSYLGGSCFGLSGTPMVIGEAHADKYGVAEISFISDDRITADQTLAYQAVIIRGENGDETAMSEAAEVEITVATAHTFVGNWTDNWGGIFSFTPTEINDSWGSVFHITQATGEYIVAQNGLSNDWNPGLWSRFDYYEDDSAQTYYCQTAYAADSEAAALATESSDTSDLDGGCNGFSWSEFNFDDLNIIGNYTDSWGTDHQVDEWLWSDSWGYTFEIYSSNNFEGYLIAQNSTANEWSPGLWSRFDWVEADGNLYYCQSIFDAGTNALAAVQGSADSNDLDGGCNGFSWTALTP